MRSTTLGWRENIEALLAYLFGWLSGIIFLILERKSTFVRFHALQSVTVFVSLFLLSAIARFIPIVGWIITILIPPLSIILWLVLMYKAYHGEKYKLPVIGDWADEKTRRKVS